MCAFVESLHNPLCVIVSTRYQPMDTMDFAATTTVSPPKIIYVDFSNLQDILIISKSCIFLISRRTFVTPLEQKVLQVEISNLQDMFIITKSGLEIFLALFLTIKIVSLKGLNLLVF